MRLARRAVGKIAGIGALVGTLAASGNAGAAGLYFSDRGVRPLGRGGAFVAGADDLGAVYYNPAGVVDAGSSVLVDASWLHYTSTYQRVAPVWQVDPNTGQVVGSYNQTYDAVKGTTPLLPIPTMAGSYAIDKDLVVAAGVYAPYAALTTYPEFVAGRPAPQRYSLLTLDGSALAVLGAFVGYRPIQELQIGVGPNVLLGKFASTVDFSACVDETLVCAREEPQYDAKSQLAVGTIVAPSATLGAIATPLEKLRVGAAFQLGYSIDSHATFRTRLPSAPIFQGASVDGDSANVKFKLPWIVRFGVEGRPTPHTRIEVAFVYEAWSVHDRIDVTPEHTVLRNVQGFPPAYDIGPLSLERHFQNAWSARLGGEHRFTIGGYELDARAGIAYEKSAIPKEYLSALTVDMDKILLAIGGGLHIGTHWRFDGVIAFLVPTGSVDVGVNEAKLYKVNPVRANELPRNTPGGDIPINAGRYSASADVLGIGLQYVFDPVDEERGVAPGTAAKEEERKKGDGGD